MKRYIAISIALKTLHISLSATAIIYFKWFSAIYKSDQRLLYSPDPPQEVYDIYQTNVLLQKAVDRKYNCKQL